MNLYLVESNGDPKVTAGLELIRLDPDQWSRDHVQDGNLRKAFEEVEKNSPVIIVIDELDR